MLLGYAPPTAQSAPASTEPAGRLVINPQFDSAGPFSEGLAPVRIGDSKTGKWGFIDKQGAMVIKPHFDFPIPPIFSEGLASVHVGDTKTGKWGYIDKQGTMVITPQFDFAERFSDGIALVHITDKESRKVGYINKQGMIVITLPSHFMDASIFSEGLAPTADIYAFDDNPAPNYPGANFKFGYINKQGTMAIKAQYGQALAFSEGLAAVFVGTFETGKWGFIDKQGKMVITPQFDEVLPASFLEAETPFLMLSKVFNEGLAAVRIGDDMSGKYGFIDKQGAMIIKPQYVNALAFSEGLAPVLIGDHMSGKWGFIDKRGAIVISPQYGNALAFSEGLAPVRVDNGGTSKWGYIRK